MLPQKPTLNQVVLERREALRGCAERSKKQRNLAAAAFREREETALRSVLAALPVEIDPAVCECEEISFYDKTGCGQYRITLYPRGKPGSVDKDTTNFLFADFTMNANGSFVDTHAGEWYCRCDWGRDGWTDLVEGLVRCVTDVEITPPWTFIGGLANWIKLLNNAAEEVHRVKTNLVVYSDGYNPEDRAALIEGARKLGFAATRWVGESKGGWWEKRVESSSSFTIHDKEMTDDDAAREAADERAG